MSDTASEFHSMVKNIVDELEAAVSGSLYEIDGEYVVIDDLDEWKRERYDEKAEQFRREHSESEFEELKEEGSFDQYDEWMEDEIGTVDDIDEPDEVSLSEYIDKQSLGDVRFEVDSEKTLYGGKALFCYGGPNIWVADDEVRGYWDSSTVEMSLDSATRSALWSWFEELWDTVKG